MHHFKFLVVGVSSFALGSIATWLYMRLKDSYNPTASMSTILFFPDERIPCKQLQDCLAKWEPSEWIKHFSQASSNSGDQPLSGLQPHPVIAERLPKSLLAPGLQFRCHRSRCTFYHSLDTQSAQIFLCIASAQSQLDICMYSFTSTDIVRMVVALQSRRQVAIRVITDEVQGTDVHAAIQELQRANIPVAAVSSVGFLMHHKVCIVDNSLVICGSMNWTRNAFIGNCENAIISKDPNILQPLIVEFDRLWKSYQHKVLHL